MRSRATQRGKRGLVSLETLEFVYISHTGVIPSFLGSRSSHFKAKDRQVYMFLMRRCCGLNNAQIASIVNTDCRELYRTVKKMRYMAYPSYSAYYDPEFAALYKSIRAQCKLIAGLKESTIKKYKQQGKL